MKTTTAAFALLSLTLCSVAEADFFGSGANVFEIKFVTINNPGNAPDTTGNPNPVGSVSYTYRIGKFEISEDMIDKANTLGGLGIAKDIRGLDKPATSVSWLEAAKFVNWLNASTGSQPAYKIDGSGNSQLWQAGDLGYNPANPYRNSLATYFLPSVDEWYKSAYYDPNGGVYYDYPTGGDTVPTPVASGTAAGTAVYGQLSNTGPTDITLSGGLSPYGTMGQGGNVWEWQETDFVPMIYLTPSDRTARGGGWRNSPNHLSSSDWEYVFSPMFEHNEIGFRVASIPEPSTLTLALFVLLGSVAGGRRRMG